ncbi:hypothetical protein K502DRAFT_362160 [Neoconidiobolus thromboides FSU 785]|nr:hypothetical protein K502DRAFT_362160 [Neoconidiobolus thromboides FSU 785]
MFIKFYLIYLIVNIISTLAHSLQEPEGIIKYYEYMEPKVRLLPSIEQLNKLQRRDQIVLNDKLKHDSRLSLSISAYNKTFKIYLEPSTELIHKKAKMVELIDGQKQSSKLDEKDFLIYKGLVINEESKEMKNLDHEWLALEYEPEHKTGWASIMIHEDENEGLSYQGVFTYQDELYNIKPIKQFNDQRKKEDAVIPNSNVRSYKHSKANSVIYLSTSINNNNENGVKYSCGTNKNHDVFLSKKNTVHSWLSNSKLWRRDSGSNYGCDMKKRVLYMGVAADCNYIAKYKTPENAKKQIIHEWNTVSQLYERNFNIKIGIIKIEANSDSCPSSPSSDTPWNRKCDTGYTMENRLGDFSSWRDKKGRDDTGLWHLMTDCKSGPQVGLAYLGTLCASSRGDARGGLQGDTGTGVSSVTEETWKVVAHEIGHNFGAQHDCTSSDCPCSGRSCSGCCPCDGDCDCKGKYLMNPSSTPKSLDFSPCSLRSMCSTISSSGSCLSSSGSIPTYSEAMCGNGIREKGEDCDCGGEAGCKDNQCCDPKTCKFKNGAQCDDQNDACCNGCKVKSSGVVCRKKAGECDLEEVCDGKSGECPKDIFLDNGTPCNSTSGDLKCANGLCTSRDAQCKSRSQGTNVLLSKACSNFNNAPCKLTCASEDSLLTCYSMAGDFADGTQCGNNQFCDKGKCVGGNFFDTILTWFQNNKIIAIVVGVGLGLILLSCLCSCICRGKRAYKTRITSQPPTPYPGAYNNNNSYPLNGMNPPANYIDPTAYNGPAPAYFPPPPQSQPPIGPGGFAYNANRPPH